jgi:4-amino-4-deoxy-L-arabinose transferase-like glycosyltransferase
MLALAAALLLFFGLSAINKPLTADEAEFGMAAMAAAETGRPYYYMGETRGARDIEARKTVWWIRESPQPYFQYGLWHPPLYLYSIAASFKAFGYHDWAARLPGFLMSFLTLFGMWRIAHLIFPKDRAPLAGALAALLWATNPLMVQQSLMLDLDNTVVACIGVWFFHEYFRLDRSPMPRVAFWGWLSVLLAISAWAKEFAPVYILAALGSYLFLNRRWRDLAWMAAMGIAGGALFAATYWAFCAAFDLPAWYFVRFTLLDKLGQGQGLLSTILKTQGLGAALQSIWLSWFNVILWTSPFYFALYFLAFGERAREWIKARAVSAEGLLAIYSLAVLGATLVYRPSMMFLKYGTAAHPTLILFLAGAIAGACRPPLSRRGLIAVVAAVGAGALAQRWIFGDIVFPLYNGGFSATRYWVFAGSAAAAFLLAAFLAARPRAMFAVAAIGLAAATASYGLAQSLAQRQPYVTAVSWNNYGERDFLETANYLHSVLQPEDVPICRKDFGYYLVKLNGGRHRKFYVAQMLMDATSLQEVAESLSFPEIRWMVLDRYMINPATLPLIEKAFYLDRKIGSFYVLKRRGA